MSEKLKITPRARRLAMEKGIDVTSLPRAGTGFAGGVNEKDLLKYIAANGIVSTAGTGSAGVRMTPLAQRIARAKGIDAASLVGSGSNGKVMKADVLASASTATGAPSMAAATAAVPAQTGATTADGKVIKEVLPYSGVRKIIGERLASSKFTAPHLYFTQKVNLEKLLDLRKQVNETLPKKTSVTDYIAKAVVKSLQKYPGINASLTGSTIELYESVNLGIAVAAPGGLIVPVIREAQTKGVAQISAEASALFDKARAGKLTPNEYSGGTFTVSNLGMFGIENFTAIINPPESAILAVSATKDEPVVVVGADGKKTIDIKPMMNITLTVDHRIIDGLLAAQCVTEIKRILENPIETLL